jgi:hypothetical protein
MTIEADFYKLENPSIVWDDIEPEDRIYIRLDSISNAINPCFLQRHFHQDFVGALFWVIV